MNSAALPPLRGDSPKQRTSIAGVTPDTAQPDIWVDYTLDELRELPFHVQLGADFSAHE